MDTSSGRTEKHRRERERESFEHVFVIQTHVLEAARASREVPV
jgi:hypothetical protein